MASEWVDLGSDTMVRRADVVAVHDYIDAEDEDGGLAVKTWISPRPQCIVILRNGLKIPAYLKSATIRKRIREAG